MAIRRASGPTGDPFWDTFRARHPDVEVVLLPVRAEPDEVAAGDPAEDDPAGGGVVPVDEDGLDALRAVVRTVVLRVADAATGTGLAGDLDDAVLAGPDRRSVRARSHLLIRPDAGVPTPDLERAAASLRTQGWRAEARDGVVRRVLAAAVSDAAGRPVRLDLTLGLSTTSGVLQVEVVSAPLAVGATLAQALLAERRERR